MKLSEIIHRVIELARAIARARASGTPADGAFRLLSGSDLLTTLPRLPEVERLREFLLAQPVAVIYVVLLVMYWGRGLIEANPDFLHEYVHCSNIYPQPADAVDDLLDMLLLVEYLEEGLRVAAKGRIALDSWWET